jgi:hypothetical protein
VDAGAAGLVYALLQSKEGLHDTGCGVPCGVPCARVKVGHTLVAPYFLRYLLPSLIEP